MPLKNSVAFGLRQALLRDGHLSDGGCEDHRLRDELGQFAKVLSRGGEVELIAGTVRSSQSQSVQPQNAFEVSEQHLDFFALTSRCKPFVLFGDGAGKIAGALVD